MSSSGQIWACDFGLGPGSGFKIMPVYNSELNNYISELCGKENKSIAVGLLLYNRNCWLQFWQKQPGEYLVQYVYMQQELMAIAKEKISINAQKK